MSDGLKSLCKLTKIIRRLICVATPVKSPTLAASAAKPLLNEATYDLTKKHTKASSLLFADSTIAISLFLSSET